ncbi:UNVERIFIED_CONTAM: hypothetical protein Sradi_1370500 [Sesamum radiatum]|uniref:Armadillo repeat-containing protein 8 n=1 Tax=Sesamum radiatum TaxID=300843 RepID=A0AAW2URT4_SESRA
MPTSATSNHPSRPEDLIGRLNSAHTPYEAKLKALRDLKNQIIGNRTKKLAFLKLGAVPSVVSILSSAAAAQGGGGDNREFYESVLIQSAAAIGSFACGLDAGVKAVLDAGAFPLLLSLISHLNEKIAALGAISNVVVDFMAHKSVLMQCGGVKQLVQLSKSMESAIRVNAVWALRNLTFLVNYRCKEEILLELTSATLISLINDPEPSVQAQALALVRNLVDGTLNSSNYVFGEDGAVLHAIARQLRSTSKVEVQIQGMYALSNVASGNELHKEAVMNQLLPQAGNDAEKTLVKFLQSTDSQLRTATLWALINLTFPGSPGTCRRVTELRNAGIITQLKNMVNDHCLDVKLRARMALGQLMIFGDSSS